MQNSQRREESCEVTLDEKLAFLRDPLSYPDKPRQVTCIETHKSWLFMTDHFVYKLKKPIAYNSVSFRALATRCHFCGDELRLNRPLAGDTYLRVVTLHIDERCRISLDGSGPTIECLVKMRRLPEEKFLSNLIAADRVDIATVDTLSRLLTTFYRSASPANVTADQFRSMLEREIRLNGEALHGGYSDLRTSIQAAQLEFLHASASIFDERVVEGRVVEGHGDLRPEHICLLDSPLIIDRLEFEPLLRIVDPADELSFLKLECERLGAPDVGNRIFENYLEMSGDRPADSLVRFYMSYRAAMWARLAEWRLRDAPPQQRSRWITRANEYLAIAERYLPGN